MAGKKDKAVVAVISGLTVERRIGSGADDTLIAAG